MKASQLLGMRRPLCLTAEVPFGKGHAGPVPFLARGQASPPAPESPFPPFPQDSPLAAAAQRLVAVKNDAAETPDCRKGSLCGEKAGACSKGCTEAPLRVSSLHRVGKRQILWLRVECRPPLGAWRGPSVPSCQTKHFCITCSWCGHSQHGLSINFGSFPAQPSSALRFRCAPGHIKSTRGLN